jgi:DNA-binding beta-propeller fold protein YncE
MDGGNDDVGGAPDAGTDGGHGDAGFDGGPPPETRGVLTIVAGNTATGWTDGVGPLARLNGPSGGEILPDGSAIYVADTFNALIRRVDTRTGEATTVAGRHQVQAVMDGVGTAARLQSPRGTAMAPDGSALYFADGSTIRRLSIPAHEVTTLAGTPGMRGNVDGVGDVVRLGSLLHDMVSSADGALLYIADRTNRTIRTLNLSTREVTTYAGTAYMGVDIHRDGRGVDARFGGIGGMARNGDALFVADTFNQVIRRVDLTNADVTTIAGTPGEAATEDGDRTRARFERPQAVVAAGAFLYTTSFDGLLRRITISSGDVLTVLGDADDTRALDGVGAAARLGIAFAPPIVDPSGTSLWYQDRSASSLRRIDLGTLEVRTLAGSVEPYGDVDGPLAASRFTSPTGLVCSNDGRSWYVVDQESHVVRQIDRNAGVVTTLAGLAGQAGSEDGPRALSRFGGPAALALDEVNRALYVADAANSTVRRVDLATGAVTTIAGRAETPGTDDGIAGAARFASPIALALDTTARVLYVADQDVDAAFLPESTVALRRIDLSTSNVTTLARSIPSNTPTDGPLAGATFGSAAALALDASRDLLYLADSRRALVRVVDLAAGTVTTLAGVAGMNGPADGTLAEARFNRPSGLVLAAEGRQLFIADRSNHTIRLIDLDARTVSTWLGSPARNGGYPPGVETSLVGATLYFPSAPCISNGDLGFVSDYAAYVARPLMPLAR